MIFVAFMAGVFVGGMLGFFIGVILSNASWQDEMHRRSSAEEAWKEALRKFDRAT